MTTRRWLAALALIVVAAPFAAAQVSSGPDAGTKAESLKVAVIEGEKAGQSYEWLAERKGQPSVVSFVKADVLDRPMARFLRSLDMELAQGVEGAADARAVAVWLTDDQNKSREFLPRAQQSLKFTRTDLAVFEGDRFGPNGWSVNGDAHLTVVVVRDGKVVKSFGFVSTNETDVPKVIEALKAAP